jgi:hypothetical protein
VNDFPIDILKSSLFTGSGMKKPKGNAIMVIFPYFDKGIWAFDDKEKGLQREPFVCGIPEIIDLMVSGLKDPQKGFRLVFSGTTFPKYQSRLKWVREESGGNWYEFESLKMEGWLCPALFHYFEKAPEFIYFKCENYEV